jgi:hypothetical protein
MAINLCSSETCGCVCVFIMYSGSLRMWRIMVHTTIIICCMEVTHSVKLFIKINVNKDYLTIVYETYICRKHNHLLPNKYSIHHQHIQRLMAVDDSRYLVLWKKYRVHYVVPIFYCICLSLKDLSAFLSPSIMSSLFAVFHNNPSVSKFLALSVPSLLQVDCLGLECLAVQQVPTTVLQYR